MGLYGLWTREENVYLRKSENAPRKDGDTRGFIIGAWRRRGWRPGGTDSPEVKKIDLSVLVRGILQTEEAAGPHRL